MIRLYKKLYYDLKFKSYKNNGSSPAPVTDGVWQFADMSNILWENGDTMSLE